MKKFLALMLALVMVLSLCACQPADKPNPSNTPDGSKPDGTQGNQGGTADLAGTYDVTLWVSEIDGVADQIKEQIKAFQDANPGIVINASVEGVPEGDVAGKVLTDVSTAPDIYCFAQDQLARLVQAAALTELGQKAADTVRENNDAASVAASTVAGKLYAYPLTSDNGYYLYYDKSIISEEEAESMESIIAACEKNGKKFRFALENAWYTASFFFATGCHSNWSMDTKGNYTNVDDDFNSANGLIAMKGMQKLAQSSCYDSNADIFTDAGAIVTGIWNANAATEHFGDNLAATDLPSFNVDGKDYHLGSYTGNKLMGVKPQTDPKKGAVLSQLAQWLTNEQCQTQRYEKFQWGPSNKKAQATDAVKANVSLTALAKQGDHGQPQGQIHGGWWDIAKILGADAKNAKSDADLQKALTNYETATKAILTQTADQKEAMGVIGNICGTNWDTDFPMDKVDDTTWKSKDALELHAGEEFKVRQGAAWDVDFGVGGPKGGNIKVEADGKYYVQLVWDGKDTAEVTLIPA